MSPLLSIVGYKVISLTSREDSWCQDLYLLYQVQSLTVYVETIGLCFCRQHKVPLSDLSVES